MDISILCLHGYLFLSAGPLVKYAMMRKEFIKTWCNICVIDCDFGFVQENAECEIDIDQLLGRSSCLFRIYCKTNKLPTGMFYVCINERILECYAERSVIIPWYAMDEKNIKALFGIK